MYKMLRASIEIECVVEVMVGEKYLGLRMKVKALCFGGKHLLRSQKNARLPRSWR